MERFFVVSGLCCVCAEERLRDFPDSGACHEFDPAERGVGSSRHNALSRDKERKQRSLRRKWGE
jgi:hypothetical protein